MDTYTTGAHQPPPSHTADHEEGKETPGGSQTKHGTPKPTAKASEAQDPEPSPQKQAEEEAEGTNPGGQAAPGKETNTGAEQDESPRTKATERAAKAPRPTPKEEAR